MRTMNMRGTTIAVALGATVAMTACENARHQEATTNREERSDAQTLVDEAAAVARQMKADPNAQRALARAKGIFIIPGYGKGAVGIGAAGGEGVALAHNGDGWSAPVFYDLGSVSIGAQAGGKAGKLAMLLMTDKALDSFRRDADFSLNASAGLTVVDYEAFAGASTTGNADNAASRPDVVVWSDTKGAFAGAQIGVTGISPDEELNQAYHGRTVAAQDVFSGEVAGPATGPIRSVLG